jgi:hypothetical protein
MSEVGRSVSSKGTCALVLGLLSATLGLSAHAQDKPILFEGIYRIGIEASGIAPPAGQCLVRGSNGYERYLWPLGGPARWCGFPTLSQFLQNGQVEFGIRYVTGPLFQEQYVIFPRDDQNGCLIANPDGTTGVAPCAQAELTSNGRWFIDSTVLVGDYQRFASIRSATDDRCLIFASDGQDVRPTLHRWTHDPSDQLYCGLGIDDLMETGQGLFTFLKVANPS